MANTEVTPYFAERGESPNLWLCVIAGDNCFEEGIEKMFDSVKHKVDGCFVSFNGEDEENAMRLSRLTEIIWPSSQVISKKWEEDFSAARNHSFEIALTNLYDIRRYGSDDVVDWLTWLDCDDIVPEEVDLRAIAAKAHRSGAHQVFMKYAYSNDENGAPIWHHIKERMFRADMGWRWDFPIHECCHGPEGVRTYIEKEQAIIHHRGNPDEKRARNRRITARWYNSEKDNPRAIQMMAHQCFAEAEETRDKDVAVATIELYRRFRQLTDDDNDDTYLANINAGRMCRLLGAHSDAINTFLQSVKMYPNRPLAYCEIAETYLYVEGGEEDAVKWSRLARSSAERDLTLGPVEEADYGYKPMLIEASARMGQKKYGDARAVFDQMRVLWPDDNMVKSRLNQAIDMEKQVAHDVEVQDPAVRSAAADDVRRSLFGTAPERSIAFLTANHYEPWDSHVLENEGLGGTESSVIRLARQFKKRGFRVVIFGTPTNEGVDEEGIEWWQTRRWHPDEPFTAFVSVRVPEVFKTPMKAKRKVLWMHDVHSGANRELMLLPDLVICPSEWHKNHLIRLYGSDLSVNWIPNGVEVERYLADPESLIERDMGACVYASSPDRGLLRLLNLWPKMAEILVDAGEDPSLKIYYGWNNIDRIIALGHPQAPALAAFKQRVEDRIDELTAAGHKIEWWGRVTENELARVMKRSGWMPYPADFCVAGDTPIDCPRDHERFPDGVPISIIEPGRLIWTINETTQKFELKPVKRVWKSKTNAPILKLTLDSGKVIRATADHSFMRRDGSWAELRDLKPGDSLMPLYRDAEPLIKLDPNKRAGWTTEYRDVAKHLFGSDRNGRHTHHVDERHYNNDPENLQDLSPGDHFSITHKGKKHGSSTRASMSAAQKSRFAAMSSEELNATVERLNNPETKAKAKAGVKAAWDRLTAEERSMRASGAATKNRETWASLDPKQKRQRWYHIRGDKECLEECVFCEDPFFNHKVVSVEPDGFEDVWDMEVEGNHNFVANGVVLHNCETFGIVFQQSLLAGCTPVTSKMGALADLLPNLLTVGGADPDSEVFTDLYLERFQKLVSLRPEEMNPNVKDWEDVQLMWEGLFV